MKRKEPNKKLRKALTINATQNYYLSRKPEKLFVRLKEGKNYGETQKCFSLKSINFDKSLSKNLSPTHTVCRLDSV